MSLIERCRRLDDLYLEWDRAYVRWIGIMTRRNRRRMDEAWHRYKRLRDSDAGMM